MRNKQPQNDLLEWKLTRMKVLKQQYEPLKTEYERLQKEASLMLGSAEEYRNQEGILYCTYKHYNSNSFDVKKFKEDFGENGYKMYVKTKPSRRFELKL